MTELWVLWPIIGIACAFSAAAYGRAFDGEGGWFGIPLCILCGAIVGPLGALWFLVVDRPTPTPDEDETR
jgi:hypothetical protein